LVFDYWDTGVRSVEPMIAWVVGASGKIGTAVCAQLSSRGIEIVGIGRNQNRHFPYGRWVAWNPAEPDSTPVALLPPDIVYYLSGQTSAIQARSNVGGDVTANVLALVNVAEAAIRFESRPHFIAAGSITESRLDIDGLSALQSMNVVAGFYETCKAAQRLYLTQYARESLLDFTVLRLSNVYGGTTSSAVDRGFLDQSVKAAVLWQRLVYYEGAEFVRDYIYIDDVAKAFVAAAINRNSTSNKTFDIGSERSFPIKEVMLTLKKLVETKIDREVHLEAIAPPDNLHAVERQDRYVDAREFRRATGWRCEIELSAGLISTINKWSNQNSIQ